MTARSCGRLIAFCLALLGRAPSFSLAAEPVRFEKRQLTDRYYCDGIAAGDINSDGKLDVVAGPFWYEGPDFRDAHEFYPAEPLPPEPSPSNSMFSFVRDFSFFLSANLLSNCIRFWVRTGNSMFSFLLPWNLMCISS